MCTWTSSSGTLCAQFFNIHLPSSHTEVLGTAELQLDSASQKCAGRFCSEQVMTLKSTRQAGAALWAQRDTESLSLQGTTWNKAPLRVLTSSSLPLSLPENSPLPASLPTRHLEKASFPCGCISRLLVPLTALRASQLLPPLPPRPPVPYAEEILSESWFIEVIVMSSFVTQSKSFLLQRRGNFFFNIFIEYQFIEAASLQA